MFVFGASYLVLPYFRLYYLLTNVNKFPSDVLILVLMVWVLPVGYFWLGTSCPLLPVWYFLLFYLLTNGHTDK